MANRKSKKKFDPNLIIAFGVLLASIGALIVSTRQASIMNRQTEILLEQSKSSAWPSLSITMSRNVHPDGLKLYKIDLSNRGTGPAIIEQAIISYDGKPVANWSEFYDAINVPDTIRRGHGNDILFNRVIKPNEDFLLIDWSLNPELMNFVYKNADKVSIQICYKSVYGDYWNVKRNGLQNNLEKSITTKIDHCEATKRKVFQE